MKITLKDVMEVKRGLDELGQAKELKSAKLSYNIAKLRRDVEAEFRLVVKTQQEIFERHATGTGPNGPTIKQGSPEMVAYEKELEEFLATEVEVYWVPVPLDSVKPDDNPLKLSEDFTYRTLPLWGEPQDKEPKPDAPPAER